MTDRIEQEFRKLRDMEAPDIWNEAGGRMRRSYPETSWRKRLVAGVLALGVALGASCSCRHPPT
jgi:hypothetical protein